MSEFDSMRGTAAKTGRPAGAVNEGFAYIYEQSL